MLRKFNTVMLWEHASLFSYAYEHVTGEKVEDHGVSSEEYVFAGGGFPIINKKVDLLGAICVSNLPHVLDHKFVVDAYAKYLNVEGVSTINE